MAFSRRVDQLEEKLANLTSMLKNPDETNGSSIATPQSTDQSFNLRRHATPTSSAGGKSPSKDLGVISHGEDAIRPGQLLFFYRSYMFDQFPFVIITPGTKADELKQQKPFLYKTVLMAASFQYKPFQDKMSEEIWEYLCTHMIIKAEKSLDLLQGLLVLMAWLVISMQAKTLKEESLLTEFQVPFTYSSRPTHDPDDPTGEHSSN